MTMSPSFWCCHPARRDSLLDTSARERRWYLGVRRRCTIFADHSRQRDRPDRGTSVSLRLALLEIARHQRATVRQFDPGPPMNKMMHAAPALNNLRAGIDHRSAAALLRGLDPTVAERLLSSPRTRRSRRRIPGVSAGPWRVGRPGRLRARYPRLFFRSLACLRHRDRRRAQRPAATLARHGGGDCRACQPHRPQGRRVALTYLVFSAPASADGRDLAVCIEFDGARALVTWLDTLPDWAAGRIRLKWHSTQPPFEEPEQQARALAIIHALWRGGVLLRPALAGPS